MYDTIINRYLLIAGLTWEYCTLILIGVELIAKVFGVGILKIDMDILGLRTPTKNYYSG